VRDRTAGSLKIEDACSTMFASLSQLLGFDAPTAPRKALALVAANQSNQSRKPKPHAKPPGKIWAQPSLDATPSRVPRRAKPSTPAPSTPALKPAETPFQTPFSPDAPPASAIHDATLQSQLVSGRG
jgi:hypothetical protein